MKIQSFTRRSVYFSVAALLMTTACKKDGTSGSTGDSNTAAASLSDSSTVADHAYDDVITNAFYGSADYMENVAGGVKGGRTTLLGTQTNTRPHYSCATATMVETDGTIYPITLTLDFGAGCSNSVDSVLRKGKITYIFTGNIISQGTSVSATFTDYYVNGYKLDGKYTITNASTDVDGDSVTVFSTKTENGIFTFPDGSNFHFSGNKTFTASTSGQWPSFDFAYDSVSVTGNSNFASSAGNSVVSTVTTPLLKKLLCPNVSAGVISFVYNQKINGTIDFGNGDCDNTATLNIGTYTQPITLH